MGGWYGYGCGAGACLGGLSRRRLRILGRGASHITVGIKEERGLHQDTFLYLYFGRPGISKGVEYLIDAAVRVRDLLPRSHLVMLLADDPRDQYQRILQQIARLGLADHITVLDPVSREELPGLSPRRGLCRHSFHLRRVRIRRGRGRGPRLSCRRDVRSLDTGGDRRARYARPATRRQCVGGGHRCSRCMVHAGASPASFRPRSTCRSGRRDLRVRGRAIPELTNGPLTSPHAHASGYAGRPCPQRAPAPRMA